MEWIVTVALEHKNGAVTIHTFREKNLSLVTDALDMVPVNSYTVLKVVGARRAA